MRIDHTDENGAVIPRPESSAQEKAEPRENTSTWGILKSGWGLFFLVAGALSVVFDLSIPGDFPLFRGGSFTLGWLFIVGVLIVPAACTRHFGAVPINSALAVIWCIAGFVAWVVIHSITAEVDPGKPVRPNLALLGGLILCWRLLTKPRQECPVSVTEEALVSDDGAQVTVSAAAKAASSPAKISLKQERQTRTSVFAQPSGASIIHAHDKMSDFRKRVLIGGLFVICAAISLHALTEKDSPSLSWTLILCGMWSAGVLLWRGTRWVGSFAWGKWMLRAAYACAVFGGIAFGVHVSKDSWITERRELIRQRNDAIKEDTEILNLAQAMPWYIEPAQETYEEVIALREWRKSAISGIVTIEASTASSRYFDYERFRSQIRNLQKDLDAIKVPPEKDLSFREPSKFQEDSKVIVEKYRRYLSSLRYLGDE